MQAAPCDPSVALRPIKILSRRLAPDIDLAPRHRSSAAAGNAVAFLRSALAHRLLSCAPLFSTDVAHHIGVNIQADIRQVVEVLSGDEPHNLADLTFGIVARKAGESLGCDPLLFGQLTHVVERRALGFGEQRTGAVMFQCVEFYLVHRFLNAEPAAYVHAELADVDARDLLTNEEHELSRQRQFCIELADLAVEQSEGRRQSRRMNLERCRHASELLAREIVGELFG